MDDNVGDLAIELRHLRYFVAVAEELSFSRAARRIHMAQPPLSRQIRRLEAHLGVQLLERTTHHASLTPAGHGLLDDSRTILASVEASLRRARRVHAGDLGALRIGYLPSTAYGPLPDVLDALAVRVPDLKVVAQEFRAEELDAALRAGRLDLAVTRTAPSSPELTHEPLAVEDLALLVRAADDDHPRGRSLELPHLARRRILMAPRECDPGFHDTVLTVCRAAGFEPRVLHSNMPARRNGGPLAAGHAVALVPRAAADDPPPGLVARRVEGPAPLRSTLVWRHRAPAATTLRALEVMRAVRDSSAWRPGQRLTLGAEVQAAQAY